MNLLEFIGKIGFKKNSNYISITLWSEEMIICVLVKIKTEKEYKFPWLLFWDNILFISNFPFQFSF